MSKPKIIIVGGFPPKKVKIFGGVVTSCRALMDSTLTQKADVIVVDSTQVSNPPPHIVVRFLFAIRRFFFFIYKVESSKPDIVILFASVGASLLEKGVMAKYCGIRNIPTLLFPRGGVIKDIYDNSRLDRLIINFALRSATKIISQGKEMREFAINKVALNADDVEIITNWTATSHLLKIGNERKLKSKQGPIKLLYVGWLDIEKGVVDLFNAFIMLSLKLDIELGFVGEGNQSVNLRKLAVANNLSERIKFYGWLQDEELHNAYRMADIFVLPSWAEGLPNAMIEAMASKLPVVVTAVGNIPSVITNMDNGLLVPPQNPELLSETLATLILNSNLRHELAESAFKSANISFGVESAVEKLLDILDDYIK